MVGCCCLCPNFPLIRELEELMDKEHNIHLTSEVEKVTDQFGELARLVKKDVRMCQHHFLRCVALGIFPKPQKHGNMTFRVYLSVYPEWAALLNATDQYLRLCSKNTIKAECEKKQVEELEPEEQDALLERVQDGLIRQLFPLRKGFLIYNGLDNNDGYDFRETLFDEDEEKEEAKKIDKFDIPAPFIEQKNTIVKTRYDEFILSKSKVLNDLKEWKSRVTKEAAEKRAQKSTNKRKEKDFVVEEEEEYESSVCKKSRRVKEQPSFSTNRDESMIKIGKKRGENDDWSLALNPDELEGVDDARKMAKKKSSTVVSSDNAEKNPALPLKDLTNNTSSNKSKSAQNKEKQSSTTLVPLTKHESGRNLRTNSQKSSTDIIVTPTTTTINNQRKLSGNSSKSFNTDQVTSAFMTPASISTTTTTSADQISKGMSKKNITPLKAPEDNDDQKNKKKPHNRVRELEEEDEKMAAKNKNEPTKSDQFFVLPTDNDDEANGEDNSKESEHDDDNAAEKELRLPLDHPLFPFVHNTSHPQAPSTHDIVNAQQIAKWKLGSSRGYDMLIVIERTNQTSSEIINETTNIGQVLLDKLSNTIINHIIDQNDEEEIPEPTEEELH